MQEVVLVWEGKGVARQEVIATSNNAPSPHPRMAKILAYLE
jgi:hypothetical protein